MNAAVETLQSVLWIGVMVDLDGEDLFLEADGEPPASRKAIREQKQAIVTLLQGRGPLGRELGGVLRQRTGIAQNGPCLVRRQRRSPSNAALSNASTI
jgi:hypothetical protein